MTNRSFKVRFYDTEVYKGKRGTTYTVRWAVNGKRHGESFKTSALADSFRATLLVAANNGEPFDVETGRPVSHAALAAEIIWYEFALQYVDAKWARISANNRKNTAKALTKVTLVLLRAEPTQFHAVEVRKALREFAFNKNRRDNAPPGLRTILSRVRRNSLPMSVREDTKRVDAVMLALSTLLDGSSAAPSSVNRERRILNVVMRHAVRQKILKANPLPKGRDEHAAPRVADAIDKRSLLNPDQVARLLAWIGDRPRTGYRLRAFFATLYYAGLRPEEAVALRVGAATLPEAGWGELLVHTAEPEVGSAWTDDGEVRKAVLDDHEYASPVGKRVYDLRHTCLTTWLNHGIPPAQVAEWAGNSVPVLLATYARCITGQLTELQAHVEGPQPLPPHPRDRVKTSGCFGKNSRRRLFETGRNRTPALAPAARSRTQAPDGPFPLDGP